MAKCGKECEIYSRITGYHRPVKLWNKGKQEEFKERATYGCRVTFNENGNLELEVKNDGKQDKKPI